MEIRSRHNSNEPGNVADVIGFRRAEAPGAAFAEETTGRVGRHHIGRPGPVAVRPATADGQRVHHLPLGGHAQVQRGAAQGRRDQHQGHQAGTGHGAQVPQPGRLHLRLHGLRQLR